MSFLNPLFLFGLAAAAIPVIIHLFTRRRPKEVRFPSLEFLAEVNQSEIRRLKLKQWLLLLLRTLAVAALALAMSRPALKGSVGLRSGASVLSATAHLANPVAAVPSLHAAYPLLLMLFFWRSARRWRWLLPLYPLAMAFTLVYTAEHYVFDIILGWLYATVVFLAGSKLFDAWEARRRVPVAVAPVGVAPVPVTVSTA